MIDFKDRLKELMEVKNLKQQDIVRDTGIPKSSLSMYLKGTRSPKQDTILILSDKYKVNIEWLHGYENVEMENKKKIPEYDHRIKEILKYFDMMNEDNKNKFVSMAKILSGEENN